MAADRWLTKGDHNISLWALRWAMNSLKSSQTLPAKSTIWRETIAACITCTLSCCWNAVQNVWQIFYTNQKLVDSLFHRIMVQIIITDSCCLKFCQWGKDKLQSWGHRTVATLLTLWLLQNKHRATESFFINEMNLTLWVFGIHI